MTPGLRERLQFLLRGHSPTLEQIIAELQSALIEARNEQQRYVSLLATEKKQAAEKEQDAEEYIRGLQAFVTATNNAYLDGEPLPIHPISKALSDKKGLLVGIADNRTADMYRRKLKSEFGLNLRRIPNNRTKEIKHRLKGADYAILVLWQGLPHDLTHIAEESLPFIIVEHAGYQAIALGLWKYAQAQQSN